MTRYLCRVHRVPLVKLRLVIRLPPRWTCSRTVTYYGCPVSECEYRKPDKYGLKHGKV